MRLDSQNIIVYQGPHFTIEWYCDSRGESQPYGYFVKSLTPRKRKLFFLVRRIAETGVIRDKTKFRYEGDDIYAFKPQPDRYLCFFMKGKKIIVVHAFNKKSDKMPLKEKKMAVKRMNDYLERNK
ncbi:type II toxin-antitoxin system RelE/ParE family toxin [Microgenomates group bacterium]|nr:type II toxin-antitoxin system RelE/ParE family toxin [Microgenomates group bacterium]